MNLISDRDYFSTLAGASLLLGFGWLFVIGKSIITTGRVLELFHNEMLKAMTENNNAAV